MIATALLLACSTIACTSPPAGRAPARPNVLIFVTDDQRASGTLGVMPNVRKWFLERGTRYTNAFATTPLCCPSRASIFTGRYAHNHGVKHNYQSHALDQDSTLQRHLQKAGYRTAIAGKFLNQWGPQEPPAHFDRWAIFLAGEYYDRQWNLDGDVRVLPDYTNDVVRERSLDFLEDFESDDSEPWFLYVGTNAAHAPFTAEPRYATAPVPPARSDPALDERDLSDKPVFEEIRGRKRSIRARQLRALMSADDLLGDVMTWLEDHDELGDTVAVFLSDNGMQWGEHGFTGKRQAYDPSVRIPLFVTLPHGRPATDDRLAANIDVAPTVLDLVGLGIPGTMDGLSLIDERRHRALLLEHWTDAETTVPDWSSMRTATQQFIEYRASGRVRPSHFDLVNDPYQLTDVLADDKAHNDPALGSLRRRLDRLRSCAGATCP